MRAWRIVKRHHAESAFDGEGARRYGGRWNSPGIPVVYTSESRALALLEILVGLRDPSSLEAYVVIGIEIDDALVATVSPQDLPASWRASPPGLDTRSLGDLWCRRGETPVLRVPSAVIPPECNLILNPAHPDFDLVSIGGVERFALDARLAR